MFKAGDFVKVTTQLGTTITGKLTPSRTNQNILCIKYDYEDGIGICYNGEPMYHFRITKILPDEPMTYGSRITLINNKSGRKIGFIKWIENGRSWMCEDGTQCTWSYISRFVSEGLYEVDSVDVS